MTTSERIKIAEDIVNLLENRFKVLGFKFGLDPLVGLIPIVGDLVPLADFLIGLVPILGDAADFVFRAHTKNLEILKRELNN